MKTEPGFHREVSLPFADREEAGLLLAVPVAARESIAMLSPDVDQWVCLAEPRPFQTVGLHYVEFDQVSDVEVLSAMDATIGHASGA